MAMYTYRVQGFRRGSYEDLRDVKAPSRPAALKKVKKKYAGRYTSFSVYRSMRSIAAARRRKK